MVAARAVLCDVVADGLFGRAELGAPRLQPLEPLGSRLDEGEFVADELVNALELLEADRRGEIDAAYPLLGILCLESWVRQFAGR